MDRLQEDRWAGCGAGAGAAGGAAVDSADDDSLSESEGDELPELGLAEPMGDNNGPILVVVAATSSSLSDNPRSLFTSGETELLEFDIRLSKPGFGRGVLRSLVMSCGFSCTLLV